MQDYRILVVDDDIMSRKLLTRYLEKMGFTRIEAMAGTKEAEHSLIDSHVRGEPFHLVLLDWRMPGEDGGQFLIKCRADERFESVPIIMATVENDPKKIRMAINKGATSYIVKPISYAGLKNSVTQALQRSERQQLS